MKMDISKLSLIFIILILITNEGSTQTLDCTVPDVIKLGEPLEISCTVMGTVEFYNLATLAKDGTNIVRLGRFEETVNATINSAYVSRVSASVNTISSTVRKLTVRYSTIQCSDNGPYEWTFEIVSSSVPTLRKSITMAVKVIPQFGSEDGNNITFSPATNLVEGDSVTFTCQGDVGNTPIGNLAWYYYLNGNSTAVDVSTQSTPQSPQDSTVAGRTCSKTRVSRLTLTLTKEMHWFVVRCTVNQDQPFTANGQGYKMTQQIDVMYKPTIRSLVRVPDAVQYTDGDPLLTLTCIATSNPAPEYYWTYESQYTNRTQIGAGNQLVIRNLTLNMTGTYTCVAYNLIKGVNQTTNASTSVSVVERTTPAPTTITTASTSGSKAPTDKPATDANKGPGNGDTNNAAMIGGIVGGCLGAILIIIIIVVVCCIRKNKKAKEIEEPPEKPRNNQGLNTFGNRPDLVSSENNLRNNMALNSSFNNSFDSTDHIKQRDDGLTYIDLQFDNKPGSRRPIQLYDSNSSGTQYADINLGSLPRV